MQQLRKYQFFRLYISHMKLRFRGLLLALAACAICLSLYFVKSHVSYDRTQRNIEEPVDIASKGKHEKVEKIVIEEVDGKKIFHIEGLHTKQLNEIRKFLVPTTLPAKDKAAMAKQVKAIYDRRLSKLKKSCGGKKSYRWADAMQLISAPSKDLTVCVVQKAASTSWHRLVLKLREPNEAWSGLGHQRNIKHAKNLPSEEKERLMKAKKGVRVITVRHPFARLISGWNDKFNKNHLSDNTRILSSLPGIEKYIGRSIPDEDHIIAFKDFAQYIADSDLKDIDIHFRTIEHICQPCQYPYSYIAKAETSHQHLWWVLDKVGGEMPSYSKRIASGSNADYSMKSSDLWEKEKSVMTAFFKELPHKTVAKLKTLYQTDFTRFGYTFDLHTMTGDVID